MKEFWERIEKIVLFLLLLFLPTQLGKHFWPEWSLVMGVRVDYLSPTVYFVDLLWFVLWVISKKEKKAVFSFGGILVGGFVLLNVLVSIRPLVAIYRWFKWGEIIWLVGYLGNHRKQLWKNLWRVLPVWLAGESILALMQVLNGGSLNGFFYWLGERSFSFFTIGIAQISILGEGLVRGYGTFSHPNSMVGFLLVGLVLWMRINPPQSPFDKGKVQLRSVWWWVVFWIGMLGVFLGGSRWGWVLGLVVIFFNLRSVVVDKKRFLGTVLIIVGLIILGMGMVSVNYRTGDFLGGWDRDGIDKRISLGLAAIKMVSGRWWTGVGMGNFVAALPEYQREQKFYWLQPAHNLVLLILSELGVLGVVMGGWWILTKSERWKLRRNWGWLILLIIGVTGLFDHYWWTLPQNMWLLGVVLVIL